MSVKLLGVHIDDKLNFNLHITKICRSAANQLHALIRFWMFLNFEVKKTVIDSYFYSSFNYCPLVWMFSSAISLNKVESLQKRALHFLYEDCVSSNEEVLQKTGKETMKVNRLWSLFIKVCKLINNINPTYINEVFKLRKISRAVRSNYKLNNTYMERLVFHSIQYRNGWLAVSDLFDIFTQSIKFYIFHYQYRCLKNVIHQIDSKNEWLLLSASFTAKFGLVFVLTLENAFS